MHMSHGHILGLTESTIVSEIWKTSDYSKNQGIVPSIYCYRIRFGLSKSLKEIWRTFNIQNGCGVLHQCGMRGIDHI